MIKCACAAMEKFTATSNWLQSLALLAARLWIAKIFFMSGLTKIKSWDTTLMLFADEYNVPVLPPEIAAYMATAAELTLPVLLVFGFMTPLAALGLFIMAAVIELFIYPGTTEHYYWILLLGIITIYGSGKFGADFWIVRRFTNCSSGQCHLEKKAN